MENKTVKNQKVFPATYRLLKSRRIKSGDFRKVFLLIELRLLNSVSASGFDPGPDPDTDNWSVGVDMQKSVEYDTMLLKDRMMRQ